MLSFKGTNDEARVNWIQVWNKNVKSENGGGNDFGMLAFDNKGRSKGNASHSFKLGCPWGDGFAFSSAPIVGETMLSKSNSNRGRILANSVYFLSWN